MERIVTIKGYNAVIAMTIEALPFEIASKKKIPPNAPRKPGSNIRKSFKGLSKKVTFEFII